MVQHTLNSYFTCLTEFRQTPNTERSVPQPKNKSTVVQENSLSHKLKCEPQFWKRQHDAAHTVPEYQFYK